MNGISCRLTANQYVVDYYVNRWDIYLVPGINVTYNKHPNYIYY